MATSPVEMQEQHRELWLEFEVSLREMGVFGGLPYGLFDHQVETRSQRLQLIIEACLTIAELKDVETWRTLRKKNSHEGENWPIVGHRRVRFETIPDR